VAADRNDGGGPICLHMPGIDGVDATATPNSRHPALPTTQAPRF